MSGYEGLACGIIEQAINDYYTLDRKGVDRLSRRFDKPFSKSEINRFFNGDWCEGLLDFIGVQVTGEELFNIVKAQTEKKGA